MLTIEAKQSGLLKCEATNAISGHEDSASATLDFFIVDQEELKDVGIRLWGNGISIEEKDGRTMSTVAVGDNIQLYCGASIHDFDENIIWERRDHESDEDGLDLKKIQSK